MGTPRTKKGRAAADQAPRRPPRPRRDERSDQLRQALEAADIGLWDWDLRTDRLLMSANMKALLAIGTGDGDEPFGSFLKIVHPEDRARFAAALKKAVDQRASFDEEFRVERSDGAVRWMRVRGGVCLGPRGVPRRVMGSIHDKTERKYAFDALEERVRDRTRALVDSNDRLRREIGIKTDLQRQMMEISEKEQRRIGQDLHDSLSQQLGGILFMGQALVERMKARGLDEAADLEKLVAHLQNALTHTRDLARGLYPTRAKGGLLAALNELACSVGDLFKVRITVESEPGLNSTDEAVTFHGYRIVQEAVNNALRHGQASRVAVRLERRKGAVVLTVADNGTGFPEKPNRKGMGLNIMEYRAASIGASFRVERGRTRGAVVKCVFADPAAFGDRG